MFGVVRSSKYLSSPVINKISSNQSTTSSQNHPDLEDLYIINRLNNNERICPNGEPIKIENDFFKGKLLIMIRTSDADETNEPLYTGGNTNNDKVSNYLRNKMRRLEIQLQVQFKKVPTSRVFLSCGYDKPVKLGFLQLMSLNAALKFCQRRNPSFSYSLCGNEQYTDEEKRQGLCEDPHFAFPIETSLDRIVVTKAGEKLPTLGSEIYEDSKAHTERQKGKQIVFNTKDTYTFCLWNSNVDIVSWKAMNLPAPKFSLTHVNDAQPMTVKLYSLRPNDDGTHLRKDINSILDVEVSHKRITSFGQGAKQYLKNKSNSNTTSKITMVDEEKVFSTSPLDSSIYGLIGFIFT